MQYAFCTADNKTYSAFEFARLNPEELAYKRRFLQCPECGGPAFFRNATQNGRIPCFGARPHAHGCTQAALDYTKVKYDFDEERNTLQNPDSKIIVELKYGAHTPVSPRLHPRQDRNVSFESHSYRGHRSDDSTHHRPGYLLRTLMESPWFATSNCRVELNGQPDMPAKEVFVDLNAISYQYSNHFRGYWGMITDANPDSDSIWLNVGGPCYFSFCINKSDLSELRRRYKFDDLEDLAGAFVLVFGTPRLAASGKFYCPIYDLDHMALSLT
jgi:hypothetical protein